METKGQAIVFVVALLITGVLYWETVKTVLASTNAVRKWVGVVTLSILLSATVIWCTTLLL